MTTCRCGAWDGHPEARSCTVADCDLRQPCSLTDAVVPSHPCTRIGAGGVTATAAGHHSPEPMEIAA